MRKIEIVFLALHCFPFPGVHLQYGVQYVHTVYLQEKRRDGFYKRFFAPPSPLFSFLCRLALVL